MLGQKGQLPKTYRQVEGGAWVQGQNELAIIGEGKMALIGNGQISARATLHAHKARSQLAFCSLARTHVHAFMGLEKGKPQTETSVASQQHQD